MVAAIFQQPIFNDVMTVIINGGNQCGGRNVVTFVAAAAS